VFLNDLVRGQQSGTVGYCMNPRWQFFEWESSDSCDMGLMNRL